MCTVAVYGGNIVPFCYTDAIYLVIVNIGWREYRQKFTTPPRSTTTVYVLTDVPYTLTPTTSRQVLPFSVRAPNEPVVLSG